MLNIYEVNETNNMIEKDNLDVRTITLGLSLLDCMDSDIDKVCDKIYDRITTKAARLVETGEEISREFGIPIVNKRISVTPIGIIGSAAAKSTDDFVKIAKAMDRARSEVGVNFIGGFSAMVQKGYTISDKRLIDFDHRLPGAKRIDAQTGKDVPGRHRAVVLIARE